MLARKSIPAYCCGMIGIAIGCVALGGAAGVAIHRWRKRRRASQKRQQQGLDLLSDDLPDLPLGRTGGSPGFHGDHGSYSGGGSGGGWNLPIVGSLADWEMPNFEWPSIEFPDIDFPDLDF